MAAVLDSYAQTLTPGLLARLVTAIAIGYSGRWNARRLENPFHAFWGTVFGEWISDLHPHALLIPQYQIDTVAPALSPDDSAGTITRDGAKELTPDFVIAIVQLVARATNSPVPPTSFPLNFGSWRDVKVVKLFIPFLAELKRPPPRSLELQEMFLIKLYAFISHAREQLVAQAEHVFTKYSYMDQVIVVACVGEWWSWRTMTRTAFLSKKETILDESVRGGRILGRVPFQSTSTSRNTRPRHTKNTPPTASTPHAAYSGPSVPFPADMPPTDQRGRQHPSRPARGTTTRTQSERSMSRSTKRTAVGIHAEEPTPPPSPSDSVPFNQGRKRTASEMEAADQKKGEPRVFHRHDVLPADLQGQPLAEDEEQAVLERSLTNWSKYLLFGTKASNQHFSLLHRVLEKQMPWASTQELDASQPQAEGETESEFESETESDEEQRGYSEGGDEAGMEESSSDFGF